MGSRRVACRDGSRETEGQRLRGLPDQIVCEARGSARDTSGASLIAPLPMGPAGAVFSSAGSPIITDLIKMKSEMVHVGAARASPRGTRTLGRRYWKALSVMCACRWWTHIPLDLNKVVQIK